jgi:hypothetical protein
VFVDGKQIGGTFTAKALNNSGQYDTLEIKGDWGVGNHTVSVKLLNDLYGGSATADRNVYVESATYNGSAVSGSYQYVNSAETKSFTVVDSTAIPSTTTPAPTPTPPPAPTGVVTKVGSGSDTLMLKITQDAYQGDSQYAVFVDGKQIGGTFTAKALHNSGQYDTLEIKGDWGVGNHTVGVALLNDLYGGTITTDRNVYVESATYNGSAVTGSYQFVHGAATQSFTVVDNTAIPSTTTPAPVPAPTTPAVKAIRVDDFLDTMGVNTHISWIGAGSSWANWGNIQTALHYLDIDHVRDGIPFQGWTLPFYQKLAAEEGVKFNLLTSLDFSKTGSFSSDLTQMAALERSHPGSVETIEGPNEINYWPLSYQGSDTGTNLALGRDIQKLLYDQVNADPVLKDVEVINLTVGGLTQQQASVLGNMSDRADYGAWHTYFGNGDQPWANLAHGVEGAKMLAPQDPVMITESGYYTAVNDMGWGGGGVTEEVQAKLTLNLFFDAAKMGVERTFLYALLDDKANLAEANTIDHSFGLFRGDGTPKQAATAIHNLTSILNDSLNGDTFATSSLSYDLSGLPSTGQSLLMQKSNGTFELAVWAEPDIWDQPTKSAIAARETPVSVTLGSIAATINVYDPLKRDTPIATFHDTNKVTVGLTDHPMIVEVINKPVSANADLFLV